MKTRQTLAKKSLILAVALFALSASCAARGPKPGAQPTPDASNAVNAVESVSALPAGNGNSNVVVTTTEAATYTVYKLQNPNRIVLDVSGATMGQNVPSSLAVNNGQIGEIQVVGAGEQNKPVTRVMTWFHVG